MIAGMLTLRHMPMLALWEPVPWERESMLNSATIQDTTELVRLEESRGGAVRGIWELCGRSGVMLKMRRTVD